MLEELECISVKDIEEAYGVCYSQAAKMIREIKNVSNIFNIKGRVCKRDYQTYLAVREDEERKRREMIVSANKAIAAVKKWGKTV